MARQHDQWLRSNMQGKYGQLDAAKQDVLNAVTHYRTLEPAMEQFIYNDGSTKVLLCLKGTIPVTYKGKTYNIPVAIWLQEQHPSLPPLCFVQPTNTMQVRQGKHVDANGKVYLPYLNEWKAGSHNLIGCIQIMIAIFSEEPPVYAKQAAPVRPPLPQTFSSSSQPPLPYPATGFGPERFSSGYPSNFPPAPYLAAVHQPAPYPPRNSGFPQYPGYPSSNTMGMPSPSYPPQPQMPNSQAQSSLDENMIKASLLSAVNDKLKRSMKSAVAQAESEMSQVKQTEEKLKAREAKLDTIFRRLEAEINDADSKILLLTAKNDELTKEISRLTLRQDNLEVDEMVTATTPLYKQIVSSFAEEQGLEDALYYLGEALHKNIIDTDTFLKYVRALSRQQFTLRAVIHKARKSAGLASAY